MSSNDKQRRRRDSSLYRDVAGKSSGQSAQNTATSTQTSGQKENQFRFVLSADPKTVPVEHRAVIEELTTSLDMIEASRRELETELGSKNSANKLQIAQLKGRLADLNRRKTEIEALLSARPADPEAS